MVVSAKKIDPPTPHSTPKSHPKDMTQAIERNSRLIFFISLICEKTHKVWFKNIWNRISNWDLMIFDLLAPPKGHRGGWGPKQMCRCMWHSCKWLTHQFWLNFKKIYILTPNPLRSPKVPPLGHEWPRQPNENPVWYVLYLSFVSRHTKFGLKIFEIDFIIEI